MRYFIVDAFTNEAFKGNPAAVVPLERPLPDEQLQAIAAEFNLAETAFISLSTTAKEKRWSLRWFTPTNEVELCGHATLASAKAIWEKLGATEPTLLFDTLSGELQAKVDSNKIRLNFPAIPYQVNAVDAEALTGLNVKADAVFSTSQDLFIEVADLETVLEYQPDFTRIAQLPSRSLVLTTRGVETDCVSRMFAPKIGIPEDSVTGAIHCTLALYWGERLNKSTIEAYQASKRGGYLSLTVGGDRVLLGGNAVVTMQGELLV